MIADARKNFQDYQTVLANVESTIAKSSAQIAHTQTTLDQAISAANSGSKSFKEAKELIKSSRKNVRAFGATFDQSMSDGETLLTDIQTTASKNLGGLETTAQQMNTLMGALKGTAESIDTDSSNSIQALDGTIAALQAKYDAIKDMPGYEAVSYTHLDVYKRQVQLSTGQIDANAGGRHTAKILKKILYAKKKKGSM